MNTRHSIDSQFRAQFGRSPELVVRSPGRVNLIGDHTDYHDGFVLPAAINLGTDIAVARRNDERLHLIATRLREEPDDVGAVDQVALADLELHRGPTWSQYVRGCVDALQGFGVNVPGANILIGGDLPIGGGLSSSASLEIGVCFALVQLAGAQLDRFSLARLGQRVENEIIGVQSGIMDQIAVACGTPDHALMIDCRSLTIEPVPIPESVRIVVLDSGIPRTLADSAYNQCRVEATNALAAIQVEFPDVVALRDLTVEALDRVAHRLDPIQQRRVHHVVTENQRVERAAQALRSGDVQEFGRLMVASHASLRDDYAVSVADLDTLVATALETPGVLGARMTGAGFGGCVVALVNADRSNDAAHMITRRYAELTGRTATALHCRASQGTAIDVGATRDRQHPRPR